MGIPSVAVLDVCVPSSVFLLSNIKKVENGDTARGTVAFAQGAKIVEAITKYHDTTAKTASEAYNIFGKYAQSSRALDLAGKGINWATHNVNPLIVMASGYKVLTSDDKVRTGISLTGALSGMFLGEGLMKVNRGKIINEQNITKLAQSAKNVPGLKSIANFVMKNGNCGKVTSILKGVAFVCASMTSFDLGKKLGDNIADEVCTNIGIEETQTDDNGKIDHLA